MSSKTLQYPSSPKNVDPKVIEASPEFRREVVKVLWSILSFILVYFFLVVAAVALALLCGYGGFMLIVAFPKLITLALGVGLMGVGIMVLYFLFKFIFSSHKVDRSNLIEITETDHPRLFEFIQKVASETQTPMPKRVYLSAEVNACVFYDSGFWTMFLPVRKNLQIGLGLVNSVNLSEFKAIVAHEFGHFSQRSMKLGSYVYNVNKVIYNMLYDNDDYAQSLQTWANFSNYFYAFAELTAGIISGIQYILKMQYTTINAGYMALSRQMEFHADSVAASVSGSLPLITSLRRFDVADNCYNRVLNQYSGWYKEHNRKAINIYQDHTTVMLHVGEQYGLPLNNGILQISGKVTAGVPECRVFIKDQWASHPSTDERESHLNQLNITSEFVSTPAWHLFTNPEVLQREVTSHLYQTLNFTNAPDLVEPTRFKELYYSEIEKFSFDPAYKGFYNNREIKAFDLSTIEQPPANTLEEVLTAETRSLYLRMEGLQSEIEMLKIIGMKTSSIRNFEFNNEKYTKEQAPALLDKVYKERDEARDSLIRADRQIYLLYHKLSERQGNNNEAAEAYSKLFAITESANEKISEVESVLREVSQLYHGEVTLDQAVVISKNMKRKEVAIRQQMRDLMNDADHHPFFTSEGKEVLERYLAGEWVYYTEPRMDWEAANLFVQAMNVFAAVLSARTFELKKQILSRQLEVVSGYRLESVSA